MASHDGGGISLARGAQFSLGIPACSPECTSAMRGNGKCDFGCMVAECNFDGGECNAEFMEAGPKALNPCRVGPGYMFPLDTAQVICGRTETETDYGFRPECDWFPHACHDLKRQLARCPLYDALVFESIMSTPGLVYVKKGNSLAPNSSTSVRSTQTNLILTLRPGLDSTAGDTRCRKA